MQSRYENLPVYKKALDLVVYFENLIRHFEKYHKYTIGSELRNLSRRILVLIAKANTHALPGNEALNNLRRLRLRR
jgi:hypothetical protein